MTKLLIIGDLHGAIPKISFTDFDAILAPGDFADSKTRKYKFRVMKARMKNPDYSKKWYELIGKKKARELLKKDFASGRKVLKFLDKLNVPVFTIPGNTDSANPSSRWNIERTDKYSKNIKGLQNIKDCEFKLRKWKDFQFIGYGRCSYTESKGYDKQTNKKIKNKLEKLFKKAKKDKKKRPVIFISHNPPLNTKIDKVLWKKSPAYGQHIGSDIAKDLIKKYKPLICESGHMHEHFGKVKIGNTVCINSGFGGNVNVLVEIDKKKIKKIKFVKNH